MQLRPIMRPGLCDAVRVYLARHGETTWNLAGRYQGRRESALTSLGMQQAFALAGAMMDARVEQVVSSPLVRCTATAQPCAERCNVSVQIDDRLVEVAHGTWEGRLRAEIAANDPERYHAWRHDPAHVAFLGGETLADVRARWRAFTADFVPRVPSLVVTHDAVARIALADARGRPLDAFWDATVENGAYAVFEVARGRWRLVEPCVTAHLAGIRAPLRVQAL